MTTKVKRPQITPLQREILINIGVNGPIDTSRTALRNKGLLEDRGLIVLDDHVARFFLTELGKYALGHNVCVMNRITPSVLEDKPKSEPTDLETMKAMFDRAGVKYSLGVAVPARPAPSATTLVLYDDVAIEIHFSPEGRLLTVEGYN
jgi:hypothetical protein